MTEKNDNSLFNEMIDLLILHRNRGVAAIVTAQSIVDAISEKHVIVDKDEFKRLSDLAWRYEELGR